MTHLLPGCEVSESQEKWMQIALYDPRFDDQSGFWFERVVQINPDEEQRLQICVDGTHDAGLAFFVAKELMTPTNLTCTIRPSNGATTTQICVFIQLPAGEMPTGECEPHFAIDIGK